MRRRDGSSPTLDIGQAAHVNPPRVVILGGGFAGLNAARKLKRAPVEVVMVDRENYHLFQPLLYQVATAVLNPSDIAYPLRSVLRRQKNARVVLAEALGIDPHESVVHLDNGQLHYDYVIVATGFVDAYFGHDEWIPHAPGLKTIPEAVDIRRRTLLAYEAAERARDTDAQRAWLRFVVVGGGPTGVELAGALSEIKKQTIEEGYRRVKQHMVQVLLVEGRGRILGEFTPQSSRQAQRQLEALGVTVKLGKFVTKIDETGITLGDERIDARTVIWAAGVRASPLTASLGAPVDEIGRVKAAADLSVPGHPNVFVAGDLVHLEKRDGTLVPAIAPAAIQMGKHAAKSIRRLVEGEHPTPFEYLDKGTLATIGRAAAVLEFGKVRMHGFLAWMTWLVIHISYLIGFRNRFWVLAGWAWSYGTTRRGARLITGPRSYGKSLPPVED
ncbi:MAG TPA: NAD(P)/FAD-dependent oxidoreductase [Acidimicrobiia bacterium]|nr:NAD(P)/FAD-dependent oxidoreductase [Acidimicrobiia bacterium]